jgi:hypothetical protein
VKIQGPKTPFFSLTVTLKYLARCVAVWTMEVLRFRDWCLEGGRKQLGVKQG